jgi:hypothetical protein
MKDADKEVEDRGLGKLVRGGATADGRADDGEDTRADDRSDAQRGERERAEGLFERVLGALGVGDQLVDGFGGEDLSRQGDRPSLLEMVWSRF